MEQDRIEILLEVEANRAKTAFEQLINSINLCNTAVQSLSGNLKALGKVPTDNLSKGINKASSSANSLNKQVKGIGKSFNSMFNLGKLYLLWNVTKRIRDVFSKIVNLSVDFIETTNKFEVSMGKMTDKAYAFQDRLSNAFGVARTDMMEFQATFNNIMSALPRFN